MQGFPFDSQLTFDSDNLPVYDRAVSSQPLRKLIRDLFTTGVMPNPSTNLQVSSGLDGMTVQVQAGFAVVDGGLCQETETRTLEVTAADTTYDRIDTVVLRWNENVDARTADLYVVAGTPSATPVRPALQRDNSIYEIGLADIFITKRVATITDDKITDTRYESERCGIVSSVSEWDTTTIYQQIQAELAGFKANEEADFATWFDSMKDQLSEDAAGNLQLEIDEINETLDDKQDKIDNSLNTTDKTIVGAINEHETDIAQINTDLTEVKGVKGFLPIFGTQATGRGAITDALQVDLTSADSSVNKVGYVYTGYTNGLPSDCSHGIREVLYYNSTSVYVKITGIASDGHPEIWMNAFNGTTWNGWCRFSSPFNHIKTLFRSKVGVPGDGRNGVFTLTTNQRSNTIYCLDIFVSARLHNTGVGWGTPTITTDGTVLNQAYNQQLDEVYTGNGYYWVQGGTYITLTMAGLPANNGNWDAYLVLRAY